VQKNVPIIKGFRNAFENCHPHRTSGDCSIMDNTMIHNGTCPNCGGPVESNRFYCSDKCSQRHRYKLKKEGKRTALAYNRKNEKRCRCGKLLELEYEIRMKACFDCRLHHRQGKHEKSFSKISEKEIQK
jgi:hypothetical protein